MCLLLCPVRFDLVESRANEPMLNAPVNIRSMKDGMSPMTSSSLVLSIYAGTFVGYSLDWSCWLLPARWMPCMTREGGPGN